MHFYLKINPNGNAYSNLKTMNKFTRLHNFMIDSTCYFIMVVILLLITKQFGVEKDLSYFLILLYYFYYFTFELIGGQTIGKMITKTKVVSVKNGQKPNFLNILIRTLSRLIPIDFLFYLFQPNGIHDILSKTKLKPVQT